MSSDNSKLAVSNNDDKNKQLVVVPSSSSSQPIIKKQKEKKVLDEDTYIKEVETIIERDFFPDLKKLKVQQAYLEAVRNNDVDTLRDLYSKYHIRRLNTNQLSIRTNTSYQNTPSTFETPDILNRETPKANKKNDGAGMEDDDYDDDDLRPFANEEPPKKKAPTDCSLDLYLAKNTSEDNKSFQVLMSEAEKKEMSRVHRAWLYDKEIEMRERQQKALALPSIEDQQTRQMIEAPPDIGTWSYTSRNSLMFIPEGVELTLEEKLEKEKKIREIKHENTRFSGTPFVAASSDNPSTPSSIASEAAKAKFGQVSKFGVDGKELNGAETPKVNGYSYVPATPSPVPGRCIGDESPMMTWGEIEGTPFRLDGSATPYAYHGGGGPEFKIPDVPEREKIALNLEEKANAARRKRKIEALKHVQRSLHSPSASDSSSKSLSDKISTMSPAAQRLLSSKLGIRPSSSKSVSSDCTPSPIAKNSPSINVASPFNQTKTKSTTSKRSSLDSLTDNLLKLPKQT